MRNWPLEVLLAVLVVVGLFWWTVASATDFSARCASTGGEVVSNNVYSRLCVDSEGRILVVR